MAGLRLRAVVAWMSSLLCSADKSECISNRERDMRRGGRSQLRGRSCLVCVEESAERQAVVVAACPHREC